MPDQKLTERDAAAAVSLSDYLIATQGGVTKRMQMQKVVNAIDLLAASGALTINDIAAIYTGGSVSQATIQKILNTVPTLSAVSTPLSGSEIVPMIQGGVCVSPSIADLVEFSNTSVPTKVGWLTRVSLPDGDASHTTIGEAFTLNSGTGAAVTATATEPQGISNATTTTLNNRANWGGNAIHWLIKEVRFAGLFRLPSIADITWQFGLSDTNYGSWTNVDTGGGTVDWVTFRFSTSAGDTNFMYGYGTGGSGSFFSTGVPANTSLHLFEVRMKSNGRLDYYIDNVKVASNINHTAATNVAYQLISGHTTLIGGTQKLVHWFGCSLAHKWF